MKSYAVHDPTWAKLFFEYGLVGFVPFSAFVVACFFADSPSRWLSAALFVDYVLLGGNLVNPRLHPLILVLAILHTTRGGTHDASTRLLITREQFLARPGD
jgi:hypothetical protein